MLNSRRAAGYSSSRGKTAERLLDEEFLSKREVMIIKAMNDEKTIGADEKAASLRGDLINAVLMLLMRDDFNQ